MIVTPDPTVRPGRRRGIAVLLSALALVALVVVGAVAASHDDRVAGEAGSAVTPALGAPATAPAPEAQPPDIGELPLDEEDLYIQVLDEEGIYYSSEDAAVQAGRAICEYLRAGGSLVDAATIAMTDGGYSAYDAGYIVGAASSALCPGSGQ